MPSAWPSGVAASSSDVSPVGIIRWFAGNLPVGYLPCDGTAVSRSQYSALFNYLNAAGLPHGNGDGSNTFNVPDLKGRSPMGSGTGAGLTARALGAKLGEENHILTPAETAIRDHTHNYDRTSASGANQVAGTPGLALPDQSPSVGTTGVNGGAVNGAGHNVIHPVIVLNPGIKYQ